MLTLGREEEIRVEGGVMVSMSPGVSIQTIAAGGIFKSLTRSVLGGESFFQNLYKAPAQGGDFTVAPVLPGDMAVLNLQSETLLVQSSSHVASEMGVELDTSWGGAKTFFASEGLFMLRNTGSGQLVISSYGAIHEVKLTAGQSYTVDTDHLVAFSANMGFKVRRGGGLKSTVFSGEGLVVDLTGPGRLLMQNHSTDAFLSWLIPKLPKSSNSN